MDMLSVDIALMFFKSTTEDIVLQIPFMNDAPLIRRHIMSRLGAPSFSSAEHLRYSGRDIVFMPLCNKIRWKDYEYYAESQLFYIGYEGGSTDDLQELVKHGALDADFVGLPVPVQYPEPEIILDEWRMTL